MARATGLPVTVTTIAEAVGSDVTNVVRSCVDEGSSGGGARAGRLPGQRRPGRGLGVHPGADHLLGRGRSTPGTAPASPPSAASGSTISYPAINTADYLDLDPEQIASTLARRGLARDGYVLFLSRLAHAKGVDDLIEGFAAQHGRRRPDPGHRRQRAAGRRAARAWPRRHRAADRIIFFDDVDDDEKPYLMAGCAAFVLPSKPRPEFVETFGIALVEKMLAGGGPVITTDTGGIGEAVGDTALIVPVEDPELDHRRTGRGGDHAQARAGVMAARAREHASAVRPGAGVRPAARPATTVPRSWS